jgi:hypothetical protein
VRGDPTHLPPLDDFRLPGRGRQEFKLHNLYVYFWRWATWKVFDAHSDAPSGVVAFISTAGYLRGPGLAGMRRYLRERADEGWIIDLTPEGHQPDVPTRIFPDVQQEICIGVFVRHGQPRPLSPAKVRYRALSGTQKQKIEALASLSLDDPGWHECTTGWEDPFGPVAEGAWEQLPTLEDLMPWNRYGVIGARNWIFAVDKATLRERWRIFVAAPSDEKRLLLKETRDRTVTARVHPLPGMRQHEVTLDGERDTSVVVVPFARRSFDRQYLLADNRVVEMARPELWHVLGSSQVFLSSQHVHPITGGPALTFSAHMPDAHCYNGRGGRVRPLWLDQGATRPNVTPGLLERLSEALGSSVDTEDILAYIAGVAAHSGFSLRFQVELRTPGLRVPLTADAGLWRRAVDVGKKVVWLHTFGERFTDPAQGRPARPLRLVPAGDRPMVRKPIPDTADQMPEAIHYDETSATLMVGAGRISPVASAVVTYAVSSETPVLKSWFEYRMKRPDVKRSSPLDDIEPREWTSEQTTELLKLLDVLTALVALEPEQEELLDRICSGPLLGVSDLERAGVLPAPPIAGPSVPSAGATVQGSLPLGTASSCDEPGGRLEGRPSAPERRPRRPMARPHPGTRFRQRRTR